jgi:hypothetical protein
MVVQKVVKKAVRMVAMLATPSVVQKADGLALRKVDQ